MEYWNIEKLIVEEEQSGKNRADYGKALIKELVKKLSAEYGKGFNITNISYMRQFYVTFKKFHSVSGELSWTHYRHLLRVENQDARQFYIDECIDCNWSTRQLERQIDSFYYERILSSKNKTLARKDAKKKEIATSPEDLIKDPYVLEFLNVGEQSSIQEKELDKLTHQDVAQMDFYVRYFEDQVKTKDDNPTIGIILCSEKDDAIVKYSVLQGSKKLFASKYKLYLPSENELLREKQLIESEKKLLVPRATKKKK